MAGDDEDALPGPAGRHLTDEALCHLLAAAAAASWLCPASVRPSVRPGGQIDTETFRDPPRE